MRPVLTALALLACSAFLGATVLREQVAWAAQLVDANITNVDAKGNIKVHEQGIARVTSTDDPARTAWNAEGGAGFEGTHAEDTFTVPAGKRLVVEMINIRVLIPEGQSAHMARVTAFRSGSPQTFYLKLDRTGTLSGGVQNFVAAPGTTRIYVGAGETVGVEAFRDSGGGSAVLDFTLSGYLVDCVAASCN